MSDRHASRTGRWVALLVALGISASCAQQAAAAPTIAYEGSFSFLAPGESREPGFSAIVAAQTGGDVWAVGSVFSAGLGKTLIRRFSPTGAILQTIADPQEATRVRVISDLAISLDGTTLYAPAGLDGFIPESFGVLRISTATGEILGAFATPGTGPGNARAVSKVMVGPDGDVYVQPPEGPLKRYGADGTYEADLPLFSQSANGRGFGKPAIDPRNGDLLILDGPGTLKEVDRYSADGTYIGTFGPNAELEGTVAVRQQDGTVYLPSVGNLIYVHRADGQFFGIGQAPNGPGLELLAMRPDGTRLWTLTAAQSTFTDPNFTVQYFATGEGPEPVVPIVPNTRIDSGPPEPTDDTTPTFTFSSDQADARFECSIDSGGYVPCTSPHTLAPLTGIRHFFVVRAINNAGADASPATRVFNIIAAVAAAAGAGASTARPPGGGSLGQAAGADRTGPVVRFASANRTVSAIASGIVTLRVGPVLEPVTGTIALRTDGRVRPSRGAGKRIVALGSRSLTGRAGETVRVQLKLSRKNLSLLARLRRLRAKATITLRDSAGNATTKTFRLTLKPPRR